MPFGAGLRDVLADQPELRGRRAGSCHSASMRDYLVGGEVSAKRAAPPALEDAPAH